LAYGSGKYGNAETLQGRIEHRVRIIEDELTARANVHFAAVLFKTPHEQAGPRRESKVDAVMTCQVLRQTWPFSIAEIAGRRHDCRSDIRTDPNRDHVLCHHLTQPDSGIELGRDNIGQAIIDGHLRLDVGVFGKNLGQSRHQNHPSRIIGRRDSNRSGRLVPQFGQSRQFLIDLLEFGPDFFEQPLADLSRRHAARGAVQQPHPESFFQAANELAETGL
jgi:hypothetical protein